MLTIFLFFGQDAEVKFIVYLENHLRTDSLFAEAAVDARHCYLDDVGGTSLDRGVDGIALGISPHYGVA